MKIRGEAENGKFAVHSSHPLQMRLEHWTVEAVNRCGHRDANDVHLDGCYFHSIPHAGNCEKSQINIGVTI
jgi:hypothetical protein